MEKDASQNIRGQITRSERGGLQETLELPCLWCLLHTVEALPSVCEPVCVALLEKV